MLRDAAETQIDRTSEGEEESDVESEFFLESAQETLDWWLRVGFRALTRERKEQQKKNMLKESEDNYVPEVASGDESKAGVDTMERVEVS